MVISSPRALGSMVAVAVPATVLASELPRQEPHWAAVIIGIIGIAGPLLKALLDIHNVSDVNRARDAGQDARIEKLEDAQKAQGALLKAIAHKLGIEAP